MYKNLVKIKVRSIISNRYEIRQIFGKKLGARPTMTLLCLDQESNTLIILKTITEKYISSASAITNLKREAFVWLLLGDHPYIVNAKRFEIINNRPLLLLEYISPDINHRNNLKHYFEPPIPYQQILEWGIQFCIAYEHMMLIGVYPHRDIKPSNILITADQNLKISDFSLATLKVPMDASQDIKEQIKKIKFSFDFLRDKNETEYVGTVNWMAPEQFKGKEDIRSDIYSFGIVLYQMINQGKLPFSKFSLKRYVLIINKKAIKLDLLPIIECCLEKDPENRFQNFNELRLELEKLYLNERGEDFKAPSKSDDANLLDRVIKYFS